MLQMYLKKNIKISHTEEVSAHGLDTSGQSS